MVGAEGFEPPTLCSQSRCATRLRYAPTNPDCKPAKRLRPGSDATLGQLAHPLAAPLSVPSSHHSSMVNNQRQQIPERNHRQGKDGQQRRTNQAQKISSRATSAAGFARQGGASDAERSFGDWPSRQCRTASPNKRNRTQCRPQRPTLTTIRASAVIVVARRAPRQQSESARHDAKPPSTVASTREEAPGRSAHPGRNRIRGAGHDETIHPERAPVQIQIFVGKEPRHPLSESADRAEPAASRCAVSTSHAQPPCVPPFGPGWTWLRVG